MLKHIPVALFLLLSSIVILSGCETNPAVEIPSYIKINKISLTTDYSTQGTDSAKIVDVWVYVDNNFIGVYTMPATFPVIGTGEHNIRIKPGVIVNGVSGTRAAYEFYTPYEKVVNLKANAVTELSPTTKYNTDAVFRFMEDFESGNAFEKPYRPGNETPDTNVAYKRLYNDPMVYQGKACGEAAFGTIGKHFKIYSIPKFALPKGGASAYLELNYNTNMTFIIGLVAYSDSLGSETPIIALVNTNNKWKKVYIDLSGAVSPKANITQYQLMIGAERDADVTDPKIYFDNIKVVSTK